MNGKLLITLMNPRRPPLDNMLAWYRKGVGITQVANAVSAWANQYGIAPDLAQASGTAQPALQAGGTILFDGSDDLLACAYTGALPRTRYIRFRQITWSDSDGIISGNTVNTGLVYQFITSPNIGTYNGGTGPSNTGAVLNTWVSLAVTTGNTTGDVLQIGDTIVTGANSGASVINGMVVGSNGAAGLAWANIEVAEILDYAAEHDATTRARIIAYLNRINP